MDHIDDDPHADVLQVNMNLTSDLDDSYAVDIPPFDGNQKTMLFIFMLLQVLLTSLTVSVNPVID